MRQLLYRPISIQSLVFLRVVVGLLGFGELVGNYAYFHLWQGAFAPDHFQFAFLGFEWVRPLPEPWMSLYFLLAAGAALGVALGWRFRWTAPAFAVGFLYLFLLEKAHYLNHAYLFCWITALLALTPAWREWSLDIRRRPYERTATTPFWCLALFPLLMGIVYFFGGIAKLNEDWIRHAMPLQLWLAAKADLFLIGPLVAWEGTAWFMAWGGALFDLSIVWLLLWRRTRVFGFVLAIGFHFINLLIFNIGIFPYLSVALTALFFPPDWPGRAVDWLGRRFPRVARWRARYREFLARHPHSEPRFWQRDTRWATPLAVGLSLLIALHVFLPLRHHIWPDDVAWTEQGHRYAWRMMLRGKQGRGYFSVVDRATGEEERVLPQNELSRRQTRKMLTHPDMILQYAHHLAERAAAAGRDVAVYAHIRVKLNAGRYHTYVDPEVDLAQQEWDFWRTQPWIVLPEAADAAREE
jgi:hypothetical protein